MSSSADFLVEAVYEDVQAKLGVLRALDGIRRREGPGPEKRPAS
jgi:hypothetical protein